MAAKGKNNQLAKDFEFDWEVMTLSQLGGAGGAWGMKMIPALQPDTKSFSSRANSSPKTKQLCPLVSLALLNES